MKQETLNELEQRIKNRRSKLYCFKHLNLLHEKREERALKFINDLLARGVPLNLININDWECATPRVYLGIAFKDHLKEYRNFGPENKRRAFNWCNSKGYIRRC